ncbi:MAG: hypothetical protein JNK79_08095 [Chitinophagaceae bacterium]|nr:hypothetical protein [Chitinophagaceae bacterium]
MKLFCTAVISLFFTACAIGEHSIPKPSTANRLYPFATEDSINAVVSDSIEKEKRLDGRFSDNN